MLEGEDLETDEGENEGVDSAKSFIEAFQMESLATYQGSRFAFIKVRWKSCVVSPLTLKSFAAKSRAVPKINNFSPIIIVNSRGGLACRLRLQTSTKKRDNKLSRVLTRASSL